MLFLIALIISIGFVCLCDKPLKKHPVPFYIAGIVITAVTAFLPMAVKIESDFVNNYIIGIFSKGSFAAALWCIVMYAGAFPNGSAPIKKIMPIRGELSIFATAVTLSHIITYGMQYIKTLSNNIRLGRSFTSEFIATCVVVIVLTVIMLPLAVMSFKKIRKAMNAKTWKNIQRSAYLFYFLIYVHILVLYIPQAKRGAQDKLFSIIVYSIVFIAYFAMRIRKAVVKKSPEKSASATVVCAICAVISAVIVPFLSYGKAPERTTPTVPDNVTASAQSTSAESTGTESTASGLAETTVTTATASADVSGSSDTTDTTDSADKTTATGSETSTDTATSATTETTADGDKDEETTPEDEQEQDNQDNNNGNDNDNNDNPESGQNPPQNDPEPTPEPEPEPEPEPQYIYNNGTYSATAFGYLGDITVTITIENDVITDISAVAADDDPEYYEPARDYILPQIQQSSSADVDACSGATYSSMGIIDAARQALSQAVR